MVFENKAWCLAMPYLQRTKQLVHFLPAPYNNLMKQSERWSSIFFNLILIAGLLIVWIAFAPVRIGGQASYVMVNGMSMEPGYHTGDLVIVRKAQTYQVGDVVTYRDAEMGAYVIHRIIGIEQGQFILKGDNNSWVQL